jgi:transposase
MTYSVDLRERAVGYVRDGGLRSEASRLYKINRKTLYHWLSADDLMPKRCGPRRRKLDKAALAAHVRDNADALLRERAAHFGVSGVAIWKALQQLKISKKNDTVRGESFR